MKAVMVKDEYPDLIPEWQYEVKKILRNGDIFHVMVEGSPRRYRTIHFHFFDKGKRISVKEAFRLQQIEVVKKKLGIK